MDFFFKTITWAGSLIVLLPLSIIVALLLYQLQRVEEVYLLIFGIIGTSIITHLLKLLFARPRPEVENLLVAMPSDFSFPSAHTSQITAFALAISIVLSRILTLPTNLIVWIPAIFLTVLVGYSRIYLQVHYVSDVIAGAAVSVFWILLLVRWLNLLPSTS